jgi:uncharacterized protein YbaP (TraB family)
MSLAARRRNFLVLPLLACALALPLACAGAPAANAAPATAAAKVPPKPLLWKVSDKDNSIYLLGSFHLLKADDYPLSSDVDSAFDKAGKVVFEVPPAQLTDPALAQKLQQLAGYGDGRTLSQVLPPAVREKMTQVLGKQHVDELDPVEPWYINLSLMIGVSMRMGFSPEQGLDMYLARRAAAAGKPVAGLETAEQQLAILDATPMDEQVRGLQDYFANPEELPKLLNESHAAWRDGDARRLGNLVIDEMRKETPTSYRVLNTERNDAWVPQLRKLLDDASKGDILVVVGAMHLLGQDGVVEKLRAKGYKVERICTACSKAE